MPLTNAGGVTLNFESMGQGDNLILLHEIGGSLHSWSAVMPILAKHCRVIAYDQRGCGRSQKIQGDFALDTHIADLRTLVAALGLRGPVHLAGCAIGTALAVRYATSFPRDVKSLVLACPALGVSEDRKEYLSKRAALVVEEGMQSTIDNTLGNSYPPEVQRDAEAYQAYRARFLENDPASYAAINMAFARFDATPDLKALRCPVLVLAGKHDKLRPPAHAREVADQIRGVRYQEIDSGHIMPMQAPLEMTAAMAEFYKAIG